MKILRGSAPFIFLSLLVFMMLNQLYRCIIAWNDMKPSEEMVTKWESHIQPLRDALPPDLKQVGYLDISIISGSPHLLDVEEFLLMQYSIAPVVLLRGINHEWVIGNFDDDSGFRIWLDRNMGNYRIQSFGFDLYLIQNLTNNSP